MTQKPCKTTDWGDAIITSLTGAQRANLGKTRYDLLPPVALRDTADIFTFGAEKYSAHNWTKGFDWSGPYQSMQRHLQAWWAGEDFDKESGASHLAHASCNLMFLQHYEYHHRAGDDRQKTGMPSKRSGNES